MGPPPGLVEVPTWETAADLPLGREVRRREAAHRVELTQVQVELQPARAASPAPVDKVREGLGREEQFLREVRLEQLER